MSDNSETDLIRIKIRVQEFLQQQRQYNDKVKFEVTCDEGHNFFILYGSDPILGIIGTGQTEDNVFENFVDNWNYYYRRDSK